MLHDALSHTSSAVASACLLGHLVVIAVNRHGSDGGGQGGPAANCTLPLASSDSSVVSPEIAGESWSVERSSASGGAALSPHNPAHNPACLHDMKSGDPRTRHKAAACGPIAAARSRCGRGQRRCGAGSMAAAAGWAAACPGRPSCPRVPASAPPSLTTQCQPLRGRVLASERPTCGFCARPGRAPRPR